MREPPVEHLDQAWPRIGRTAIQQVADELELRKITPFIGGGRLGKISSGARRHLR
jgi:hypothetical protein